jgi:hypothetical protein
MKGFRALIGGRDHTDPLRQKATFPGGPLMVLTEGNYYLCAVLDPIFQVAVMRYRKTLTSGTKEWTAHLPIDLMPGPATVIPLTDLGKEVT